MYIEAIDLELGDIILYCGCTYYVKEIGEIDEYGNMLIKTEKRSMGRLMSSDFHIVRGADELILIA